MKPISKEEINKIEVLLIQWLKKSDVKTRLMTPKEGSCIMEP